MLNFVSCKRSAALLERKHLYLSHFYAFNQANLAGYLIRMLAKL